jgi:hypothetical protein
MKAKDDVELDLRVAHHLQRIAQPEIRLGEDVGARSPVVI